MYMYKPSFLSSAGLKGLIGFDTMLVSVIGETHTIHPTFQAFQPRLHFSQWVAKQKTTTTIEVVEWEGLKQSCNSYCVNLGLVSSILHGQMIKCCYHSVTSVMVLVMLVSLMMAYLLRGTSPP